jgi:hypothetical protein
VTTRRNRSKEPAVRRKLRAERRAAGICVDCPNEASNGARCLACAAKASARARVYYRRHAARIIAASLARYYQRKAAA